MANYFVAGVGNALLFEGDTLFAECKTLADSSITIGVTAEDIRGGEGNALYGQYYHDASFSMKLTDIMFNLNYIAANTGADLATGGEVFAYAELTSSSKKLTVADAIALNNEVCIWAALKGTTAKKAKIVAGSDGKFEVDEDGTYCVLYRKNDSAAEKIKISSQFIPKTLHAVLTVALYSGDACNVESATKAGEIVIDIPRLQLTGAMDISMTATGAAQTPLEGNALASGCTSCDGKAIYATITKSISGTNWYDEAFELVIEDLSGLTAPVSAKKVVAYACYQDKAPKKLENSEWTLAKVSGDTGSTADNTNKTITATASDTNFVISATAVGRTDLKTTKKVDFAS